MAWQKTKICLEVTVVNPKTGKKQTHRYLTKKSKGKNTNTGNTKLELKKYCPITKKHELYQQTKISWK